MSDDILTINDDFGPIRRKLEAHIEEFFIDLDKLVYEDSNGLVNKLSPMVLIDVHEMASELAAQVDRIEKTFNQLKDSEILKSDPSGLK